VLAIGAAGLPVALAGVVAGPVSAAVRPAGTAHAATYSALGGLAGVAAVSERSAWAVGYAGSGTRKVLMLHWNGTRWSRVTSPKVLTGPGSLSAVTVVSAKDAWAVGSTGSGLHPHSLILHWNGRAWNAASTPAPVASSFLSAVTATAKGGWAVGYHTTGPSVPQTSPLIFRLTGTRWSRADPKFGAGTGVAMDGVATTTAGTTFATGLYTGQITGVLARWSGSSWNWTKKFPEQGTYHWLNGIAAGPHGSAFAVGFNTGTGGGGIISTRWTGHAWVRAPGPASSPYTVAFAPGGTAWAAGTYGTVSRTHAQVFRWTGRAWSRASSPGTKAQLNGLGFAGPSYGWAVGQANYSRTYILHWNGHTWS
jgi:hypothetical protein